MHQFIKRYYTFNINKYSILYFKLYFSLMKIKNWLPELIIHSLDISRLADGIEWKTVLLVFRVFLQFKNIHLSPPDMLIYR